MDDWSLQLVRSFDRIALSFAVADSFEALTRCAEQAIDQLVVTEHLIVYWLVPGSGALEPCAVRGFPRNADGSTGLDRLAGMVFASGRRLDIPDVVLSSEGDPSEGAEGVRALLCLPVRSHERMVGTFAIGHADPGTFDDVQVAALGLVTKLAGVAYETVGMLDALRAQQRTLAEQLEELRIAQNELRMTRFAVDRASDGFLLFGPDARFTYVNEAACKQLGYPREALLQMSVHDVDTVLARERWPSHWQRIRDERVLSFESRMRTRNGDTFPAEVTCNHLEYGGNEYGAVFVRDASQRKQLQAQLAQADRMASIGTLAAGVAHEINNPLTYALTNADQLRKRLAGMARDVESGATPSSGRLALLAESAADCCDGVRRACDIVRDLRTFSHVDTQERRPIDLATVIDAALRMATQELKYRARVVRAYEPDVPRVLGNEGRLSQVFLNLLVNAAHAMSTGGPETNTVTVRVATEGDEVIAEVADTGQGMTPEQLSRVFEPFFTTKPPGVGVGLGLWVSHNIVQSVGGRIEVTSSPGGGARFRVRLPAHAPTSADSPRVQPTPTTPPDGVASPTGRARVLVVDDEPRVGASVRSMLSPDHDVVVVASAAEARHVLADGAAFDLLICDLMMPDASGADLFEWLRTEQPAMVTRVTFMTGGTIDRRAREIIESARVPVLEKPFEPSAVVALVARAMARPH
ncbi:MAG: PAS domain S-box protein [Deltaproteobacteria bacterium]|nr:PAS domain S-box protein [Deltaproteobacteria bacterium]